MKEQLVQKLIDMGNEIINSSKKPLSFSDSGQLIDDIENHSHLFLLGCIADKQIKADRAWEIPIKIAREIGGFDFDSFKRLSEDDFKEIFKINSLHRFNDKVASEFKKAIELISEKYNGKAKMIWDEPNISAATVVGRFLEFQGAGQKIASMAVNILYRDFKKEIKDLMWIDISPDIHVQKVFKRTGLVHNNASKEEIIWKARELHPEYPGVFDLPTFEIGVDYCKKSSPNCIACPISNLCEKLIN